MFSFIRSIFFAFLLLTTLFSGRVTAQDTIKLTIPQTVITNATKALLPINVDTRSKSLDGDITIINISNLKLTQGFLACRLRLAGNNLAITTEIGGHNIRLKVGAVELDVTTNAALRFDAKNQILYIKPFIKDVQGSGSGANGEIGKALVAMLNGREFPINMQELEPLVANTGTKTVKVDTKIMNIEAKPASVQLSLMPIITAQ